MFTSSKNWDAARSHCQSFNADLASIKSSKTNHFLTQLTQKEAWIGGYVSGSVWKWINDETMISYTNWYTGEPNNWKTGTQNRIQINYKEVGFWDDLHEGQPRNYICEKLKIGNYIYCRLIFSTKVYH